VRGTAEANTSADVDSAALFRQNCSTCHGTDGRGIRAVGTPNFADPAFQRGLTSEEIVAAIRNGKSGGKMPAWSGKLTEAQINALATYTRSFDATRNSAQTSSSAQPAPRKSSVYTPGDDVLFSLPTGRAVDRNGLYVNFSHRFPYDPAFTGTGRGEQLFGLDGFAIPSLGLRYGVTDRLSISLWRSPSIIGRPIQLMAAYNILDEHQGSPLNMAVRFSVEGQNNFRKNYTENIEAIFSRSLTSRAQIYLVPTVSFNDRPLVQSGDQSSQIPDLPGTNAFSLGVGGALDIRPTVALVAEVIPTLVNGRELGIHRPAYSFGFQKKIWRHSFTLGLTTSPGTTVSERADTRATLLRQPNADTPSGMFFGFDLTRQIH